MPVGYYNFSPIMQGNQTIANGFASLGQQIGNAIETHAQTQAATAMLPALQQSYQQGMAKIASGDPNGMADIYGAAASASQIPMLQPFAQHALTTAQSANINAQHMARTQAYLQGRAIGNMSAHPEMYNPDGTLNTSRLGQPATPKGKAPTVSDLKNANDMDSKLADSASQALRLGDQQSYDSAMQQRASLRNQFPNLTLPAISGAVNNFDTASQLLDAQKALKAEKAKGTGNWIKSNTDPKKVKELQDQIQKLQTGGIPSATGANSKTQQDQDSGMQNGNATFNSPDDVKAAFQAGKISQDQAVQLLQAF